MRRAGIQIALIFAATLSSGCLSRALYTVSTPPPDIQPPPEGTVPVELNKITLPPYMIEPPDVVFVEVMMPPLNPDKQPYSTALPPQPISGQFLVGPDGTIGLGIYGTVQIAGMTRDQAREHIREFVAKVAEKKPEALQVTVDIAAYNSKVYYIFTDGAGFGEPMYSFPCTGNETVLDALARIGGVPSVGSKKHIWIARRSCHGGHEQILPVDYCKTTMEGITLTNYQVLPGDRIYVQSQPIISFDNALAKIFSPIERTFGVVLLGSTTVNTVSGRFTTTR